MKFVAVTFDYWMTLGKPEVSGEEFILDRVRKIGSVLERRGFKFTFRELYNAYIESLEECSHIRRTTYREVSVELHLEKMISKLGVKTHIDDEFKEAFVEPFYNHFKFYPDAESTLAGLRKKGYKLAVISNTPYGWAKRKHLERSGLIKYFDVLSFSDEVGVRKPSVEIFYYTLDLLGVSPGQTVHVGDSKEDIEGAQLSGLHPVLFYYGQELELDCWAEILRVGKLSEILNILE
ncbi:MAG: hypothetical protein DRN81_01890 [Thermoproteota archaeon]|nr:MAG: hypothetical protein DRN81_01890 [Candidatus Korarchaeota archaeon]